MRSYLLLALLFFSQFVFSQESFSPRAALKWAPSGLFAGNISLLGEYKIGNRSAFTAKIGVPAGVKYHPTYDNNEADFRMKAFSFLAGYRMYLSKQAFRGFYFEPYFKYVDHNTEGTGEGELDAKPVVMAFSNDYSAAGIGLELGVQFLVKKRFTIDVYFFGPEVNLANSNFRAVEVSNSIPWNTVEANEAEQDIRNFIDNFPFIRNRVTVKVDNASKTVTADFEGKLPGYRAGISFGVLF